MAMETENKSFLLYAKIKVKGFFNGFSLPIAEIPSEDEIIHVGVFSLGANSAKEKYKTGYTEGVLARSVGESYVNMLMGGR